MVRRISIHAPLAGCDSGRPRWQVQAHISIHAPLAGRDYILVCPLIDQKRISIHAPLAGRDYIGIIPYLRSKVFQSTRPLRGATVCSQVFSINCCNFNPRAPCGARRPGKTRAARRWKFQSTRPLRGATTMADETALTAVISIHAPLAGRDDFVRRFNRNNQHFNPRAPCGARLSSKGQ